MQNPNTCCDGAIWTLNESPSEKEGKSCTTSEGFINTLPQ